MDKAIEITNFPRYIKKQGGSMDSRGYLQLPESLGVGYVIKVKPLPPLTIMLQHYKLKKNITIKRSNNIKQDTLLFSFRNVISKNSTASSKFNIKSLPSVQISTSDVVLDIKIPPHFEVSNIIIAVELDYLREILQKDNNDRLTRLITEKKQSYLYEEILSSQIQTVAQEIFQIDAANQLANFLYKVKSEELIYLFLQSLLQRDNTTEYPVNQKDTEAVFLLKEELFRDLSTPPQLQLLASRTNMSVSKLGKIFRQIFGDSIYNYYQKLRMQEAAILLRDKKISVSEVGYQLGFSNLSHFTRLFEKHIGTKPKKYSKKNPVS
jgi:AraC-like DNA-binding protein